MNHLFLFRRKHESPASKLGNYLDNICEAVGRSKHSYEYSDKQCNLTVGQTWVINQFYKTNPI